MPAKDDLPASGKLVDCVEDLIPGMRQISESRLITICPSRWSRMAAVIAAVCPGSQPSEYTSGVDSSTALIGIATSS
jgi:hypothetical protein